MIQMNIQNVILTQVHDSSSIIMPPSITT